MPKVRCICKSDSKYIPLVNSKVFYILILELLEN